jgi:hypothetical protein
MPFFNTTLAHKLFNSCHILAVSPHKFLLNHTPPSLHKVSSHNKIDTKGEVIKPSKFLSQRDLINLNILPKKSIHSITHHLPTASIKERRQPKWESKGLGPHCKVYNRELAMCYTSGGPHPRHPRCGSSPCAQGVFTRRSQKQVMFLSLTRGCHPCVRCRRRRPPGVRHKAPAPTRSHQCWAPLQITLPQPLQLL